MVGQFTLVVFIYKTALPMASPPPPLVDMGTSGSTPSSLMSLGFFFFFLGDNNGSEPFVALRFKTFLYNFAASSCGNTPYSTHL